ncbi:hypothetical protein Tcan_01821 [Toxocara canis]|uniref:MATH domain-containing protein n=1 Tax=Toxocara canis TaxID=6265 RepID=A0A0B2URX9_TOXCA|nr:hypothetical protein Tcan_01821 [Toxocara canis]
MEGSGGKVYASSHLYLHGNVECSPLGVKTQRYRGFQNPDVEARNDIEYVIQPTPIAGHKPFLDRPISERNASFGAVRFCELNIAEKYIRDDVMFLKVDVENSKSLPFQ